MRNRLRDNFFWLLAGNGFYALMQWLQLSVISKGCSTLMLGTFTLALAVSAPVFQFLGLQLRNVLVTDHKGENTFSEYFVLRLWTMLLSFVGVLAFGIAGGMDMRILAPVIVIKVIEGIAEIFNAQQQKEERMQYIALSVSLKGLTATAATYAGVYWLGSLSAGLWLAVFLNFLVLIFNDYLNGRRLFGRRKFIFFRGVRLKRLIIRSLPLGVVMLIISLNANVPKYFTEYFLGTEMQGIYSAIAYCLILGTLVSNAIGHSFVPRMSRYYAEGHRKTFAGLVKRMAALDAVTGAVLFIFALAAGKWFLGVMFNEEIASYSRLFPLVMFGGMVTYTAAAFGYTLTSMRHFKIQPFVNGSQLAVNAGCCFFFIKAFGIDGIAYAHIAGSFAGLVVAVAAVLWHYRRDSKLAG